MIRPQQQADEGASGDDRRGQEGRRSGHRRRHSRPGDQGHATTRSRSRSRQGVRVRVVKSTLSHVLSKPDQAGQRLATRCSISRAGRSGRSALTIAARHAVRHPEPAAGQRRWRTLADLAAERARSTSASTSPAAASCCSRPMPPTPPSSGSQAMEDTVTTELRRDPRIEIGDISTSRRAAVVHGPRPDARSTPRSSGCATLTQPVGLTGSPRLGRQRRRFDARRADSDRRRDRSRRCKDAMTVARDVVRRRIDPQGTKEVTVINQGERRILVQVPGRRGPRGAQAADRPDRAARVQAGRPDRRSRRRSPQGRAPAGSQVLPMADGTGAIAVKRRVMVSGDQLIDAKQGFDQDGQPVVVDHLQHGRRAALRPRHPGERRQAVRDHPRRQGAVGAEHQRADPRRPGADQRQLHRRKRQRAGDRLASGKLPVKLNVIEERTVGPELGKDSIRKGAIASIVATLAVILFMLVTYGRFGVYATVGADRERAADPRHHGDLRSRADAARHRRLRADHRRGGRRQRADQRAHPRGAAARAQGRSTRSRPATRKRRPRSSTPTSPTSSPPR